LRYLVYAQIYYFIIIAEFLGNVATMSDVNCEITQSTPVEFNSARKLAFDKRFSSIKA